MKAPSLIKGENTPPPLPIKQNVFDSLAFCFFHQPCCWVLYSSRFLFAEYAQYQDIAETKSIAASAAGAAAETPRMYSLYLAPIAFTKSHENIATYVGIFL